MQNAWFSIQHLDRASIEVGGLCYFYFTPVESVLQWPVINPLSGTITDDLVLKAGKSWLRCEVIEKDRSFSENQKSEDPGDFFEMNITGFLPNDTPVNTYTTNLMKNRRFAIVTKERNGIMRLIGNSHSGATFIQSYSSSDANGARGRSLSFQWQSPDSAPLYLTAVTADGDVINPPWVPPTHPSGSGRMVYDPIYLTPSEGQTTYTDSNLIGKELILIAKPPIVMYPGILQTEYTFTSSTGTISFHNPLHASQKCIIIYADHI